MSYIKTITVFYDNNTSKEYQVMNPPNNVEKEKLAEIARKFGDNLLEELVEEGSFSFNTIEKKKIFVNLSKVLSIELTFNEE